MLLLAGDPAPAGAEGSLAAPSDYGIGILACGASHAAIDVSCLGGSLKWLGVVRIYHEPREEPASVLGTLALDLRRYDSDSFEMIAADGAREALASVEVVYEAAALIILERSGDWLRTSHGWISGRSIGLGGQTVFLPWRDVLGYQITGAKAQGSNDIGWFYSVTAQPLYDAPGGIIVADDAAFGRARDGDEKSHDFLVLERKDNWIKVVVDETDDVCSGQEIRSSGITGWIRLTDEQGHPLVYWRTRGC